MGNIITWVKVILTALGTTFCYFIGGIDAMLITLLTFMVIDYITGVMCAIVKCKLSSSIGFAGICKKAFIILLVGAANLLGMALKIEGLRYIFISFYLANEGISIIENASVMGLPVPEKIKSILEQLKTNKN